jgi:hypothetical protein
VQIWPIVKESLQGSALSALLLGIALGLFTNPDKVVDTFYEPLFRGLLSVLMLIMGIEAYARLNELRRVAHWFAVYAAVMPIVHGLIAFGLGYIAHVLVGFSPGGVVLLAIIAGSSSDISGPPTLRAGIPTANPSSYIGSSTSIGTPVAIAIGIPLYIGLAQAVFGVLTERPMSKARRRRRHRACRARGRHIVKHRGRRAGTPAPSINPRGITS